jgi:UDP-glucuronate 4-epimerase
VPVTRRDETFLVTGAYGCIGAWTVRVLLDGGATVVALDPGVSDHRLRALVIDDELAALDHVAVDITDRSALAALVADRGVTHIVHLAALQVPFCRADPSLGAMVNVVGTVNVFEAAKAAGLTTPVVYASSVAAYDNVDSGSGDPSGHPSTHYGVTKLANEGAARVYAADDGVASIGLRPYVVYGVGRDQGMTSSPTAAMRAAAMGEPFAISYSGPSVLQLARDAASCFVAAARSGALGAAVHNMPGVAADMTEVVDAIAAAVPSSAGRITIDGPPLPFPATLDVSSFVSAVGDVPVTSLRAGVAATIAAFRP